MFKIISRASFKKSGKESACNAGYPSSNPGLGRSAGEGIGYPLQYSWTSLVAHLVKNPPAMQETGFNPWVGKIPWRRERLPTSIFWPGEFHGLYRPLGHKESDITEQLSYYLSYTYIRASQVALVVKQPICCYGDIRDVGSVPGSGRSLGEGHDNPLQYSCLGNLMDKGAWEATIQGVARVGYE